MTQPWFATTFPADRDMVVAYFCAEFGLGAAVPIYSGGLGILAGDHLKAAADLEIPVIGVGLFYAEGYFSQQITADGQHERYLPQTGEDIGATRLLNASGIPICVCVEMPNGPVYAHVWRIEIGTVQLLLLDARIPENTEEDRGITARLYGGDRTMRLRQEMLLGIGGIRALAALGISPTVYHLNEGHSVFLQIERLRHAVTSGRSFDEAFSIIRASSVFTTHTPVPAGNEVFTDELAREFLAQEAHEIGVPLERLIALGKVADEPDFGLTPLALRTSGFANGVSALHGQVARRMWHGLWPHLSVDEVPIGSITNGVHLPTWQATNIAQAIDQSDRDLWNAHRTNVEHLVALASTRGAVAGAHPQLRPDALTIGFSRRFATYKRAGLLFRDPDRLARLVSAPHAPVQIVIAGKAHPADTHGKALIEMVMTFARDPRMAGRIVFVPDYDMAIGATIVQGTDVWLNTPRLPMEASGTSGMKAAINGSLNLSILDGWWAEGFTPNRGWAIDDGIRQGTDDEQDARDHASLMTLLETEVVPRFYARDSQDIPPAWVQMMRAAITEIGRDFSATRMVREYAHDLYVPAHRNAVSA